jgi:phosphatidylglycerophosphate synthase
MILIRTIKGTFIVGSTLFLTGAFMYIFKFDSAGMYIYLVCALCFLVASLLDAVDYEITHRAGRVAGLPLPPV